MVDIVDMELATYVLGVDKERKHRNIKLPVEQMQALQRLAEWRYKVGIDSALNWTAALSFVVKFFEAVGGFDKPEDAMAKIMEAVKAQQTKKK